jgi:CheY-like chemotaxis protein
MGKGTGMGLATVYGTVEHGGGWIEVQSELGSGTTFRIYLPRTQDALLQTDDSPQDQLASGNETVLVVEDELAILKFVRTALQRQGYTVVEATSAEDALLLAASGERPLHLLLTDLVMPNMNGRDLYERVAALHPGIKIILMSGYSADVPRTSDQSEEAVPFLGKPFSMKQLSEKVRAVLDNGGRRADVPADPV